MMAALAAARNGARTLVLERNEKPGKKIYITGKGRCNFTNDCDRDSFLSQVCRNPRFLYSALDAFSPQDMMALLESSGCPVTVQRGQRAFPASEKASDVTRALVTMLSAAHAEIRLGSRVASLIAEEHQLQGVELENGERLQAGHVILATGGLSYPSTGSDGDGYRLAAQLGHTVIPQLPALIPLETDAAWIKRLQGLSLRNVRVTLRREKKVLYSELGEMLFTHFGVSGPLILEMSCHLPDNMADLRSLKAELDLKPGLSSEQLDARLQREFSAAPRKQLANVLPSLMPVSLAAEFPALCGIPGEAVCGGITKPERGQLVQAMKHLTLPIARRRPISEAIVTRGGIPVREVNPKTMESRLVSGLFFAGEILDLDAHTGGFNLQIAWSTGYLAGSSAAVSES